MKTPTWGKFFYCIKQKINESNDHLNQDNFVNCRYLNKYYNRFKDLFKSNLVRFQWVTRYCQKYHLSEKSVDYIKLLSIDNYEYMPCLRCELPSSNVEGSFVITRSDSPGLTPLFCTSWPLDKDLSFYMTFMRKRINISFMSYS